MKMCRRFARLGLGIVLLIGGVCPAAAQSLPVAEQNALIAKHCAVCHNDRTPNGGLSLQGYDVRTAPDSLNAMLLSKIAQGLSLAALQSSHSDNAAKALVTNRMMGGAMMAAGVAPPPTATIYALVEALAGRTQKARDWNVERSRAATGGEITTVSTVREVPREEAHVASYRLIATCNAQMRAGELRLSWSPLPKEGSLTVAVDDDRPVSVTVAGMEKMGNGLPGETPPASAVLRGIRLPDRALTFGGLHGDTVSFDWRTMPRDVRQALSPCFR